MTAAPPAVRKVASETRDRTIQPCKLLLTLGYTAADLDEVGISTGKWAGWGTLLNRKVEVKSSSIGGKEGRGLFAGISVAALEFPVLPFSMLATASP